jgi:thiamine transporter
MSENPISTNREKIMAVAAGGVCLALAEVLSIMKIYEMPQGGSVTLASMLPIILFALCFGPAWGLGAAFIYSGMQLLIGAYFLTPVQVLLDYTLAFTALGVAGFFAEKKEDRLRESNILKRLKLIPIWKIALATIVSMLGRLVFSYISGIVFYGSYAPEGQPVWLYSLLYNGTFLLPEAVITFMALIILLQSLALRPKTADEEKMPASGWAVMILISLIPVFGQIALIVWALDKKSKRARKMYSVVFLTLIFAGFVVWLVASVVKGDFIKFW